ncbi:MAG: hypothetical protein WCK16_01680 [Candidatus Moraniibacteriota bacterium]
MLNQLKKIWQTYFFTEHIFSPQNGLIKVRKFFGAYEVIAGGCFQSGWYVTALWRKMLKRIHPEHKIKTVLMLGLGGGGGIAEVRKKFPLAHIIAIEHDPIMANIAKRIMADKLKYFPELIMTDAKIALEALVSQKRKFDVIISDIFNGTKPSPLMYSADFISLLSEILEINGYLLVNFYKNEKTIAPILGKYFSCWERVKYQFNRMRVYRHFGRGKIGDSLPKDFNNKEQSKIYLQAKPIGKAGCLGQRYSFSFFAIEWYICDQEPTIIPWKGLRLIIWRPITKVKNRKGWWRNFLCKEEQELQLGFAENSQNYWHTWSTHAKRHREKWKNNQQYVLRKATITEFEKAYLASGKLDFLLRTGFMRVLYFHHKKHAENLDLYLVKNKQTEKDIAGLATVNYPDVSQSRHTISFIYEEAQKTSVGYGLIDNWFLQTQKLGIKWLDFGVVWKKGNPNSWKSYSKFKQQFGLRLIKYPRSYFKITVDFL